MLTKLKNIALALLRKPLPHAMTNLLLRWWYGADIAFGARIYYPLNVRLEKGCRIGEAKLEGHPWSGITAPTLVLGEKSAVEDSAMLIAMGGMMSLGKESAVNPYVVLYSAGDLTIGDYCRIAAHTVVIPENHVFASRRKPICKQGSTKKGIVIGDDVWIGAGGRILDGVTIGKGAVIGAGAVVTKDIPPYMIAVGVPARPLRERPHGGEREE